jgi:hypothetical protein
MMANTMTRAMFIAALSASPAVAADPEALMRDSMAEVTRFCLASPQSFEPCVDEQGRALLDLAEYLKKGRRSIVLRCVQKAHIGSGAGTDFRSAAICAMP